MGFFPGGHGAGRSSRTVPSFDRAYARARGMDAGEWILGGVQQRGGGGCRERPKMTLNVASSRPPRGVHLPLPWHILAMCTVHQPSPSARRSSQSPLPALEASVSTQRGLRPLRRATRLADPSQFRLCPVVGGRSAGSRASSVSLWSDPFRGGELLPGPRGFKHRQPRCKQRPAGPHTARHQHQWRGWGRTARG